MEYKVVQENNIQELENMVSKLIGCGWEPLGGLSFSVGYDGYAAYPFYTQSMVRKNKRIGGDEDEN